MEPFFLVFALVAMAAIALGVLGYLKAKKRREALAMLAAERGWTYEERNDSYARRWRGEPFGRGHDQKALNILTGEHDGRPFAAFDYVYYTTETSTDANGNTTRREVAHDFSVVAVLHGSLLPRLVVRPEGPVGRLFGRLTNTDIQFESEEFNRAFTVNSSDRKFASDVIHPRMMEQLLRTPYTAFRFQDDSILAVDDRHHTIPELMERLDLLDRVLDNVPDFVWRHASEYARDR